jgi:hypothetical protein
MRARARASTSLLLLVLPSAATLSIAWPFATQSKPSTAATTLLSLLVASSDRINDNDRINALVDECVGLKAPFKAEWLADGELWRAVSIVRGEVPRWEKSARLLPTLKNRAGQCYESDGASGGGRVTNYGEVLGRSLYFKAEGSFTPAGARGAGTRCPVDFDVSVERGGFVLAGQPFLSSAISGPGFLRCLYIDRDMRIFESPKDSPDKWEEEGLVVVQVRDSLFADAVEGEL